MPERPQPHESDRVRSVAVSSWVASAALRFIQAVIDNDVRGIVTLGYRPQSLSARIIEVPHGFMTLIAIAATGWLMLRFVHRRTAGTHASL